MKVVRIKTINICIPIIHIHQLLTFYCIFLLSLLWLKSKFISWQLHFWILQPLFQKNKNIFLHKHNSVILVNKINIGTIPSFNIYPIFKFSLFSNNVLYNFEKKKNSGVKNHVLNVVAISSPILFETSSLAFNFYSLFSKQSWEEIAEINQKYLSIYL